MRRYCPENVAIYRSLIDKSPDDEAERIRANIALAKLYL